MVKIPICTSPLLTSSLSQGFLEKIDWPIGMPDAARRSWCRVLAQVIAPLREHLKDTLCPLVAPGSPAELALEETKKPLDDLMNRMTILEIVVNKRLEQFEVSWVAAAEAVSELEFTLCKQKLDKIKAVKEAHQHSEFRIPRRSADDVAVSHVAANAGEEEISSAAAAAAGEEETTAAAADPGRGRQQGTGARGARARTVSPLMVPVLWGFGGGVPTGLLPMEVLRAHTRQGGSIIRRSTPDAHPKWRLLAPDHPELKPFRPNC